MARKKKARQVAKDCPRVPDEELIARLEGHAPEVLVAKMPEAVFDATVRELLKESPFDEVPHFLLSEMRGVSFKNARPLRPLIEYTRFVSGIQGSANIEQTVSAAGQLNTKRP